MKKLLPIFLLVFCASALAQTKLTNGAKVNGVGLEATYNMVIRKFGKPVKEKNVHEECTGGTEKTLDYHGLSFTLYQDNSKKFTVADFSVKYGTWNVSGAKIGVSMTAIRRLFGDPSSNDTEAGQKIWYYSMPTDNPGNTVFYFRNGKVVKIISGYQMC